MKRKLVIHIGAHKTGSTFIQKTFNENIELLSGNGIAYFGGSDARVKLTRNIIYPAVGLRGVGEGGGDYKSKCRDIVKNRAGDHGSIFLSNENILGFCDLIASDGYIYPESDKVLSFLNCLTEEWDVKFVYFIRNYGDFLESTYIQKIKEGRSYDFGHYKKVCDINKMSWLDSIENLKINFGSENVTIIKYEDFKNSQAKCVNNIISLLGGDGLDLKVDPNLNVNPSYSEVALELARQGNSILPKGDVPDYRRYLIGRFPSEKYGRPNLLSEQEKYMYREKYERDCAEII